MTCTDCIHYGVCWRQRELLADWEMEEDQECCEEVSRFAELPVVVGQQVWFVRNGKIEETIVEKVVLKHRGFHIKLGCNAMYETSYNSIGKTVFLTREEAEEALRKEREK